MCMIGGIREADCVSEMVVFAPQVELLAGGTKHKTKVQRKTTAPIFEEAFTFKGTDRNGLGLSIEVKHKNMISADVLLGRQASTSSPSPSSPSTPLGALSSNCNLSWFSGQADEKRTQV